MKANKIFAIALVALALVACNKKTTEVEVTSVTLDQTSLTLEVGASATLVATVTPEGAATVEWSSSDESKATVANGVVTAVAEGNAIIVAKAGSKQASCIVTIGSKAQEKSEFEKLLDGTDYYVFALDATTYEKIASKVKDGHDFRINGAYQDDGTIPDDVTSVLEIWGRTLTGGAGGGLNCFGLAEGYISLVQQDGDWSGNGCGGLRQTHRICDLTGVTGDYKLAIAYKCPANNSTSAKVQFTCYSTIQGKPEVPVKLDANTQGEWKLYEKSMADLFAAGLDWSAPADCQDGSFAWYSLGLLIEPTGGFDVDAIVVYK